MYKIRNKKFALLLTIVFVLTIMMPLATPASAATTYGALTTPTVTTGSNNVALGTLTVKFDPAQLVATSALVSLPSDYEVLMPGTAAYAADLAAALAASAAADVAVIAANASLAHAGALAASAAADGAVSVLTAASAAAAVTAARVLADTAVTQAGLAQAAAVVGGVPAQITAWNTALASWNTAVAALSGVEAAVIAFEAPGATVAITFPAGLTANEFRLQCTPAASPYTAMIPLRVNVPSGAASGDIEATITGLGGQLVSGTVVVGKIAGGAVTVTAPKAEFISSGDTVTFTISENAAGALKLGNAIKLTLPKGFEWSGAGVTSTLSGAGLAYTAPKDATNDRILYVNVTARSTAKGIVRVTAGIDIDDIDAKHGDIEVTIGGLSSVSPSKLVVAKYADFGVKLSAGTPEEILAGRYDQEIGDIVIEETAPGSFVANRTILLTLPSGAKWVTLGAGNLDIKNANATVAAGFSNSDRTARITLGAAAAGLGKITIEDATIATKVNFGSNDLKITASGSAGVSGDVVVAKVTPAISATATKPTLTIGAQGQAAGDIIITEAKAEALIQNKNLTIIAPAGVTFEATPKVTVEEGDIDVTLTKAAGVLTLAIDGESSTASKIKISGITLTVNRSVPEGNVELAFGSAANPALAVDEVNDPLTPGQPWFTNDRTALKVINAVVGTPAPGDTKMAASFVIGAKTYTLNGVVAEMDVVPYVKDGRTYLPVRYVGYALGVAPENILWDGKTATLVKGDKVVQVSIGSKAMIVNGATINLDAAPELKDGRTMLPFRWIAWAFGAAVDWDAATQTVTMKL